MKYQQITHEERILISRLRRDKNSIRGIAKLLNRAPSTISREFKRNSTNGKYYKVAKAQEHANGRKVRSRKKAFYSSKDWKKISSLIKDHWSPEQVSLVLHLLGILNVSHQTIYKYIKRDRKLGGNLWSYLRQSGKIRRKGYGNRDSRGVLAGKRELEARPIGATNRSSKGHFEIDLVHGGKDDTNCILTLVDRKTRFTIIKKLPNKKMKTISKAVIDVAKKLKIKTITADNGTEWHDFRHVEKRTGIKFYFAKPYHSWERGTNENTNGLIRQFLPKRQSMKYVSQCECNAIAKKLNRRPRKILNLDTPEYCHLGIPLVLHFKV